MDTDLLANIHFTGGRDAIPELRAAQQFDGGFGDRLRAVGISQHAQHPRRAEDLRTLAIGNANKQVGSKEREPDVHVLAVLPSALLGIGGEEDLDPPLGELLFTGFLVASMGIDRIPVAIRRSVTRGGVKKPGLHGLLRNMGLERLMHLSLLTIQSRAQALRSIPGIRRLHLAGIYLCSTVPAATSQTDPCSTWGLPQL